VGNFVNFNRLLIDIHMLVDTHCHLNFKAFNKDLPQVIDNAEKAGITKIIIPGAKLESSKRAVEISQKYDFCFAAVGIHPHHAGESTTFENEFKNLVKQKKVMAIGEIGLDYHHYKNYPAVSENIKRQQKDLLLWQLDLAKKNNLPLIFHCREAFDDQLTIINSFTKSSKQNLHGVFHCFSGEKDHLRRILDLCFFVGIDGNITYSDNNKLQEMIKYIPLDRILLETDAPFLTPIPFRNQRNEPKYLTYIVSFLAQLYNTNPSKIMEITSQNALKLFNL
jgi:TatD DNase family protein